MTDKLQKIIDAVAELSVVDLAELVKALEEKFGVTAQSSSDIAGPTGPAAGTGEANAPEEQSAFTVVLATTGDNKIGVIKALREINPQLGLKEAKDLSEKPGTEVVTGVNKATAEEAKTKLTAAGATVELK